MWCCPPPPGRRRTAPSPTPTARCRWAAPRCRCRRGVRQDLDIIVELARRLGLDWAYAHPREVFAGDGARRRRRSPTSPGSGWSARAASPIPATAPDGPGEAIVFGDRFPTASGRARFVTAGLRDPDEMPDDALPADPHHRPAAGALAHRQHDPPRRHAGRAGAGADRLARAGRAGAARPGARPAAAAGDAARRDRAGGARPTPPCRRGWSSSPSPTARRRRTC